MAKQVLVVKDTNVGSTMAETEKKKFRTPVTIRLHEVDFCGHVLIKGEGSINGLALVQIGFEDADSHLIEWIPGPIHTELEVENVSSLTLGLFGNFSASASWELGAHAIFEAL